MKICKLISLLPDDLRDDPNLYHEELCITIKHRKICESYGTFSIYNENNILSYITRDIDEVKELIEEWIGFSIFS